jgi:hypothetical protein
MSNLLIIILGWGIVADVFLIMVSLATLVVVARVLLSHVGCSYQCQIIVYNVQVAVMYLERIAVLAVKPDCHTNIHRLH